MVEVYNCYILILLFSKEHFKPNLRVVAPAQQVLGFFSGKIAQKGPISGIKKAGEPPKIEKIKKYLRFVLFGSQLTKKNLEKLILKKKVSIAHCYYNVWMKQKPRRW